ncbi:hypothetical protein ACFQ0R_04550 [Psychroflexus salinarum]|uniref:Uncharacterized protein n=1 Tax=Psychroflexus salinarum TaxID=546024 RepID=A0ABW3GRR7_9FLAO
MRKVLLFLSLTILGSVIGVYLFFELNKTETLMAILIGTSMIMTPIGLILELNKRSDRA